MINEKKKKSSLDREAGGYDIKFLLEVEIPSGAMGRKALRKRNFLAFHVLRVEHGLNIYAGLGLSESVQAGETIRYWRKP